MLRKFSAPLALVCALAASLLYVGCARMEAPRDPDAHEFVRARALSALPPPETHPDESVRQLVWSRVAAPKLSKEAIRQNPKIAPSLIARAEAYLGMTARQVGVRTTLWCAAFMNKITGGGTGSNMARSFASWGKPARPGCRDCVAVLARPKGGPQAGHVGVVKDYDSKGNPVIVSGNHGGRVAVAVYPKSRVIAWRAPPATLLVLLLTMEHAS